MFKPTTLSHASRLLKRSTRTCVLSSQHPVFPALPLVNSRLLSTSSVLRLPSDKELDNASTSSAPGASGDHEGQFARTDEGFRFEQPEDKHMPPSKPVRGRGGEHALPTLATFSLDKRVVVVTGGARGLGLVMGQGCIISGADLAIVDLNS